ncbi:MAG: hypothetical protein ACI4UU_00065 [Clostridia bacterium]
MEKINENKIQNQIKEVSKTEKEEIGNIEEEEDVTKYGEFVSSYFAWLTLERQKKQTKKMENMTEK